ncbi:MAG TPA: recombinase RecA [Aggregatilinea sp.]|jgi:recombination protein RecA|uniref:recombinase RecA n=1 Tax=Aggregatilinea sp. TaxID=2806333 RepID=UPI002C07C14B|nr:recombinase RecA [Aggregatilinea sp.]HML22776.1 recombinase RecA [Aggregatilinea sp.]
MAAADARQKALDSALADLTKRFGDGTIVRLGDAAHLNIEVIPTGSLAIDLALGVGGIPRGRVIEIYGPESSGKTTLCLHVIAQAQAMGGTCAFVDMEHALDPVYAQRLGVDINNLYISQPDMGEQALEITEALVRSGAIDVVILDSVAALVPRAELEGTMGDSHVGLQARLMSQALRKLSGAIKQSNTSVLFTNQLREKIGVMFGNPETTTGGRALRFYASIRMDIRRIQAIKQKDEIIGNRTRVKITKNKVAPPFRQCEIDLMYDRGFCIESDVLDLGVECGIIDKRGAFFRYNDGLIGQGRENAKQYLRENPDLMRELEMLIRNQYNVVPLQAHVGSDLELAGSDSDDDASVEMDD